MNSQEYIGYIEMCLSILATRIDCRAKLNVLDLNIYAETFYAEIINLVFGYNVKNAKETFQQDDWPYYLWLRNQQANNEPETRIKNGKSYLETNVFYHYTFKKLCHWLSMFWDIFETGGTNPDNYLLDGKVNIEQVRKVLRRVAVINLKKSWGKATTDREALKLYATKEQNSNVFKKQLKEMETNVVLCCSPDVFWIVNLMYDEGYQKQRFSEGNKELFIADGYVFVKLVHPQWYGKKESVLADEVKEIFEWAMPIIKKEISGRVKS